MNIALLSTGFMKSGKEATGITLMEFAKELTRLGNGVTIIAEKRGELNRRDETNGIHIYRIGGFKYLGFYNRIFGHVLGVRKMQKSSGKCFDVIHSFSAAPILVLRSLFSKLFSKNAITVHTLKSYSRDRLGNRFYGLLNLADKVTVPTKVFADMLMKKGVKKNKIEVIRSHIDTKKFAPKNKQTLKKKYGYKDKKTIFYYGALYDEKGPEDLVDAMPLVTKKHPDSILIMAPRENINSAKPLAEKVKKQKNIIDINKDINIVDYINLADVVCLPYRSLKATEGNPSCLLEAIACKTTVVTTELAEIKEILKDEKEVLMAKQGDYVSLARKINRLLSNKKLQKRLVDDAYKKSKDFDVRIITKKFLGLYKKLLAC